LPVTCLGLIGSAAFWWQAIPGFLVLKLKVFRVGVDRLKKLAGVNFLLCFGDELSGFVL
jgi:hypothetical protein